MRFLQRHHVTIKWIAYVIAFLIVYFFSAGVFDRFPLWGGIPCLLPAVSVYCSVWEGRIPGAVYGLCIGLFNCLAQNGDSAGMILCCALIGWVCGSLYKVKLRRRLLVNWVLMAAATAFAVAVEILPLWLFEVAALTTIIPIALGEFVLSVVLALPAYPLYRFVARHFNEDYISKR